MDKDRYHPSGKVQGDTAPFGSRHETAEPPPGLDKSLEGAGRRSLKEGFHHRRSITSDTKSDGKKGA